MSAGQEDEKVCPSALPSSLSMALLWILMDHAASQAASESASHLAALVRCAALAATVRGSILRKSEDLFSFEANGVEFNLRNNLEALSPAFSRSV